MIGMKKLIMLHALFSFEVLPCYFAAIFLILFFLLPWSNIATGCKGTNCGQIKQALQGGRCSKSLCLDRTTGLEKLNHHIVFVFMIVSKVLSLPILTKQKIFEENNEDR